MIDTELLATRLAFTQMIVNACQDVGKTKIQKITYFLQESLDVPLNYPFRIHYYGPYSDDLDGNLSLAKSFGHIDISPDAGGFGYHVTTCPGIQSPWLSDDSVPEEVDLSKVNETIRYLSRLSPVQLELWATVHFIIRIKKEMSKEEALQLVGRLKPKFDIQTIESAYQALVKNKLI